MEYIDDINLLGETRNTVKKRTLVLAL